MSHEAYARIDDLIACRDLVLLDGGVASEVSDDWPDPEGPANQPANAWAIYEETSRVLDVHRRYAAAAAT